MISDAERIDAAQVARTMSEYARDGQKVTGVERPELLSDARLDKSLEDGRAWLAELQEPGSG